MHELQLFGLVPPSKHSLVVSALAGLTALQPQALVERHLLYRPQRAPGTPPERSASKRAAELGVPPAFVNDTFYVQAVGNLAAPARKPVEDIPTPSRAAAHATGGPSADMQDATAAAAAAASSSGVQTTAAEARTDADGSGDGGALAASKAAEETPADKAANVASADSSDGGDGGDAMVIDKENAGTADGQIKIAKDAAAPIVAASSTSKDGDAREDKSSSSAPVAPSSSTLSSPLPATTSHSDLDLYPWQLQFRDVPAVPGRNDPASKRVMLNVEVPPGASPTGVLQGLGYRFVSEHMLVGHRFTHGNIDLRLFRGYEVVPASGVGPGPDVSQQQQQQQQPVPSILFDPRTIIEGRQPPLQLQLPPLSSTSETSRQDEQKGQGVHMQALDESGFYMLQARLAIGEDGNPEVISAGLAEMGALRDTLRGLVDLELGDRLTMNTRIR